MWVCLAVVHTVPQLPPPSSPPRAWPRPMGATDHVPRKNTCLGRSASLVLQKWRRSRYFLVPSTRVEGAGPRFGLWCYLLWTVILGRWFIPCLGAWKRISLWVKLLVFREPRAAVCKPLAVAHRGRNRPCLGDFTIKTLKTHRVSWNTKRSLR